MDKQEKNIALRTIRIINENMQAEEGPEYFEKIMEFGNSLDELKRILSLSDLEHLIPHKSLVMAARRVSLAHEQLILSLKVYSEQENDSKNLKGFT